MLYNVTETDLDNDTQLDGYSQQWARLVAAQLAQQRQKRQPKRTAIAGPLPTFTANQLGPFPAPQTSNPVPTAQNVSYAAQPGPSWVANTDPFPPGPYPTVLTIDAQGILHGPNNWLPPEVLQSSRYKALMLNGTTSQKVFGLAEYGVRSGLIHLDASFGNDITALAHTALALFEQMNIHPVSLSDNKPI